MCHYYYRIRSVSWMVYGQYSMHRDRRSSTDTSALQTTHWVVASSTFKIRLQRCSVWRLESCWACWPGLHPYHSVPGIPQVKAILRRVCYLRCSRVEDEQRGKTSQKTLRVDVSLCPNPTSSSSSSYVIDIHVIFLGVTMMRISWDYLLVDQRWCRFVAHLQQRLKWTCFIHAQISSSLKALQPSEVWIRDSRAHCVRTPKMGGQMT